MTQKLVKNIIGNVASSYQVNLAIEVPNIAENYRNLHILICRHWYLQSLFKYTSRCWEVFFDWPDIFLLGRAWSYLEHAGKTWYEISYTFDKTIILSISVANR